jgi:hypothetical protein
MLASRHFIGAHENRPSNSMATSSTYVSLLQVRLACCEIQLWDAASFVSPRVPRNLKNTVPNLTLEIQNLAG